MGSVDSERKRCQTPFFRRILCRLSLRKREIHRFLAEELHSFSAKRDFFRWRFDRTIFQFLLPWTIGADHVLDIPGIVLCTRIKVPLRKGKIFRNFKKVPIVDPQLRKNFRFCWKGISGFFSWHAFFMQYPRYYLNICLSRNIWPSMGRSGSLTSRRCFLPPLFFSFG